MAYKPLPGNRSIERFRYIKIQIKNNRSQCEALGNNHRVYGVYSPKPPSENSSVGLHVNISKLVYFDIFRPQCEALGNNYTICGVYSTEPGAEINCVRLNFIISKLGYYHSFIRLEIQNQPALQLEIHTRPT